MEHMKKIALVTGASRGIGRDTAFALSQKGFHVIITYQTQLEKAILVAEEIRSHGNQAEVLQLDTSNIASFDEFTSRLSVLLSETFHRDHFDFLVNNAGIGVMSPFLETTEKQFDDLMNIHVKGVFFLTQKLCGLLADHGGIVNISSGLTRFATPGASAYASAKGAIEVLTKYMAKELGSRGIRVNAVAPGPVDTNLGGGHGENQGFKDFIASSTTLGRIGVPKDIGTVIASLCSPEMEWVTAQRLEASGGMLL